MFPSVERWKRSRRRSPDPSLRMAGKGLELAEVAIAAIRLCRPSAASLPALMDPAGPRPKVVIRDQVRRAAVTF